MSFKAIAKQICKDQTTVSKEVKRHLTVTPAKERKFDRYGKELMTQPCPLLLKSPFVCNGCQKRFYCTLEKRYYNAKEAQRAYQTLLVESREGIPLSKESFYEMDRVVSNGIKRGQHLYHIAQTNSLGVSKSTIYRHLHRGYLSVTPIDFPRVVKFKSRYAKKPGAVPKAVRMGRTHDEFLAYIGENGITYWTEMDTVIGRVGGKVVLTFDFTLCNFMFGLLLEDKTAAQVTEKIQRLKALFASHGIRFGDVFPLILTDNGGEFANVGTVENSPDGDRETLLYFCDPYQSSQKPRVEKNHTLFRDIVPKGESFDEFNQDTVNLIFSHVNSIKRKVFNGKSPYELFAFTYGERIAGLLGIQPVPANQVVQSPLLLKNT